jgi:4-diphosphocytidyl-2-C-methyl-D-erythritol kinase
MIIRTPAKINIGLNVVHKREDGYHDLNTFFYPINLCDEITIVPSSEFSFKCSDKLLEKENNNLILQAVRIMEQETGRTFALNISLKKNIPVGAGLGGGSSDAGAMLLYLNDLADRKITSGRLKEIALNLGSDVPFFLNPLPSYAESRGEVMQAINLSIPYPILIVNPGIHIPTRDAFGNITPALPVYDLREIFLSLSDYSSLKELVTNDFEPFIFDAYPEIGEIKSRMYYAGAVFSLMTGTGSSVFGIFADMTTALKAEKEFKETYYTFLHSNF